MREWNNRKIKMFSVREKSDAIWEQHEQQMFWKQCDELVFPIPAGLLVSLFVIEMKLWISTAFWPHIVSFFLLGLRDESGMSSIDDDNDNDDDGNNENSINTTRDDCDHWIKEVHELKQR